MTINERFQQARALSNKNAYVEAADIYISIIQEQEELKPFCYYRLADILNSTGQPMEAYDLYYKAFYIKPDITSVLHEESHPSYTYVFKGKKEENELTACPLCNSTDIHPKWCYPLTEACDYSEIFNPIRLWMYCEPCHHMFARHFPDLEKTFVPCDDPTANLMATRTPLFGYYSKILSKLAQYAQGSSLLEVGIGACECLLAARELGYDTFGIDVLDGQVHMARTKLGLDVQTVDFLRFQCEKKFDVIIMGDVIEHVNDPVLAIEKAYNLLNDNGVIWISTPNFDGSFSVFAGHFDAMKREPYHLNYFSRFSLFSLLEKFGFTPVEYNISAHYNGSMEVIAVKTSRFTNESK